MCERLVRRRLEGNARSHRHDPSARVEEPDATAQPRCPPTCQLEIERHSPSVKGKAPGVQTHAPVKSAGLRGIAPPWGHAPALGQGIASEGAPGGRRRNAVRGRGTTHPPPQPFRYFMSRIPKANSPARIASAHASSRYRQPSRAPSWTGLAGRRVSSHAPTAATAHRHESSPDSGGSGRFGLRLVDMRPTRSCDRTLASGYAEAPQ